MTRLLFHFSAMAMMFYEWGLFSLSWWWIVIALIVCTGIINAYNFMDGINGITGGYSLVILAALAYINKEVVTFVEADFIYIVICSVLVFCFFVYGFETLQYRNVPCRPQRIAGVPAFCHIKCLYSSIHLCRGAVSGHHQNIKSRSPM